MNKIDRYKILVRYAINNGIATSQSDLGVKLGYNNASAFSQLINCKSKEPKEFSKRLLVLIPDLNIQWLDEGIGSMLKVDATAQSFHEASNKESNEIEELKRKLAEAQRKLNEQDETIKTQANTIKTQADMMQMMMAGNKICG